LDKKGNVVYYILSSAYGVNGTAIPGAPSDRRDTFTAFVPIEALIAVTGAKAQARRCEGPGYSKLQDTVSSFRKGIDAVKEDLKKAGTSVAEVVTVIRSL
jgi:hypothetical protein